MLDTSFVIALFARAPAVPACLSKAGEVFVPSIALGELFYGARKSARVDENIARLEDFAAHNSIPACDADTARLYGRVKRDLHAKGRPAPDNDIWIAALAWQHDLDLLTRDDHFSAMSGLRVERW